MDNIIPEQVPENNKINNQQVAGRPEQTGTTQIVPEEIVPDIKQEQIPSSQINPSQVNTPPNPPANPAKPVVVDQPVKTTLNVDRVIEEEEKKVNNKEMPWVEKAEKIIAQDKDKPYLEEEESEKLQHEYLAKNYGVNVEMDETKAQPK